MSMKESQLKTGLSQAGLVVRNGRGGSLEPFRYRLNPNPPEQTRKRRNSVSDTAMRQGTIITEPQQIVAADPQPTTSACAQPVLEEPIAQRPSSPRIGTVAHTQPLSVDTQATDIQTTDPIQPVQPHPTELLPIEMQPTVTKVTTQPVPTEQPTQTEVAQMDTDENTEAQVVQTQATHMTQASSAGDESIPADDESVPIKEEHPVEEVEICD